MTPLALTIYVLAWPAIVMGVLGVIVRAFTKELRQAKRDKRSII